MKYTMIKSLFSLVIFVATVFFCGCKGEGKGKSGNPDLKVTHKIRSYVEKQEELGFKGSVLVSKSDTIIYTANVGEENRSEKLAYYIGSLSKQFTAAAIVRLYEDGLLSLDDTLDNFFEKVPDDKRKITIHHLLTHTSGLPDNYVVDGISDRQEAINAILTEPLENEVGVTFSYSAEGYNLLAIIVEIVSGKQFEAFVEYFVIKPMQLKHTGFWGLEESHVSFAPFSNDGMLKRLPENVYANGKSIVNYGYKGSTGMYATLDDLYQWIKSLRGYKCLSERVAELLFEPNIVVRGDSINGTFYGYGWFVQIENGIRKEIRHGGSEEGFHNGIVRWTHSGYTIIVLSNQWAENLEGRFNGVEWSTVLNIGIRDIVNIRE